MNKDAIMRWALSLKPVRAFLLYSEHRGPVLADGITYRALFSVFAAVLLGFTAASMWLADNPTAWDALVGAVDSVIPGLVANGDGALVDVSQISAPATITVAGIVSIGALIFAAMGAVGTTQKSMRMLADEPASQGSGMMEMVRNFVVALFVGVAIGITGFITVFATSTIGWVNAWLGIDSSHGLVTATVWIVQVGLVFALDAVIIAVLFVVLSGVKANKHSLWAGAAWGAVGLVVLQTLSSLFVGGATSNPLLATFASLIALLLWMNLSIQVILIATSYILVGVEEEKDRVWSKYGAPTMGDRRVRRAEAAVRVAMEELEIARTALSEQHEKARRAAELADKKSREG